MNNKIYHVLWIDDEHDTKGSQMIDSANLSGFKITCFKTSTEGMDYLRKHHNDIDAVILDAKCYAESEDETPRQQGMRSSFLEIARISEVNGKKEIPHIVLTGQPDLVNDEEFEDSCGNVRVFYKTQPSDEMFAKLKSMIDESGRASVRNRFPEGYKACQEIGGPDCWNKIFPALDSLVSGTRLNPPPFNELRKVAELACRALHDKAVIDRGLIRNGELDLSRASKFLSAKRAGLKQGEQLIPALLGQGLWFALDVVNAGSHTEDARISESGKKKLSDLEGYVRDHRSFESSTLIILDFVIWTSEYLKRHPDPVENMKNWR